MPARVTEGSFARAAPGDPDPQCRAEGEFVGRRGELASYAFGWRREDDSREARISIGIGAGLEGGGTFHLIAQAGEDGIGYLLVDEPFADVPQGGPHLSADHARSHGDLRYIWHVLDTVMSMDSRAPLLQHFVAGTPAIATGEVADGREPVLLLANDLDEQPPMWQAIGRSDPDPATGRILHLSHLVDDDPSLAEVLDLAPGEQAERVDAGAPWVRTVVRAPTRQSALHRLLRRGK